MIVIIRFGSVSFKYSNLIILLALIRLMIIEKNIPSYWEGVVLYEIYRYDRKIRDFF